MSPKHLIAFFCLVTIVGTKPAIAAPAPTAPGTYHDWHDVDEVTIIQPFVAANYSQIAVESFDSGGVKLPPANENTHQAVLLALQRMKPAFIQGVGEKAKRKTSGN